MAGERERERESTRPQRGWRGAVYASRTCDDLRVLARVLCGTSECTRDLAWYLCAVALCGACMHALYERNNMTTIETTTGTSTMDATFDVRPNLQSLDTISTSRTVHGLR